MGALMTFYEVIMVEPAFIRSRLMADHGVTAIFSLRQGGISPAPFQQQNFGAGLGDPDNHIEHHLSVLARAAALPSAPHQTIQTHQTDILYCTGPGRMHSQQADILLTDQANTALAVRVADCLPVLLADPTTGIVAAVHAGWRGTAACIVGCAISAMLKRGATRQHLLAWLGPCIGSCCFAIGEDAAEALRQSVSGAETCISHVSGLHADLRGINRLQLKKAGISDAHIESVSTCTACNAEHFFSFRRDHGRTGRHLAVVATASST